MKFKDANTFTVAMKEWNVRRSYGIKWTKNERKKMIAICKQECKWRIYALIERGKTIIQIKSFKLNQGSLRTY